MLHQSKLSSAIIIVLTQLFCSWATLHASELPLELLQDHRVNVNGVKSMDYARRMAFPLASADDNDIELPPHVEDNFDLNSSPSLQQDDETIDALGGGGGSGMPKWLQMQLQADQQHQHSNNHAGNLMVKQSNKHQHQHHVATASPLRRCSIEVTNKIPGICQSMGTIGNACVSGEYLDVFNADCF